jgi:hypothetical protein
MITKHAYNCFQPFLVINLCYTNHSLATSRLSSREYSEGGRTPESPAGDFGLACGDFRKSVMPELANTEAHAPSEVHDAWDAVFSMCGIKSY